MANPFVYAVKQNGNLIWARHIGQEAGSFLWDGPRTVGKGWGNMKHLFAGDDGIFYAIDKVIPATAATGIGPGLQAKPASGGDLWWYRHVGREDGSLTWEGPKKVGSGWGNFQQVFYGGDGIIYAVDPFIPATLATGIGPGMGPKPASGGDLWWYRHVGSSDGSFKWEGPKKVGTGWGNFTNLFSAGDGIIYGIDKIIPATLPIGIGPGMQGKPASGGDLYWFRHVGRSSGTFKWQFPDAKKVGSGWGGLRQVFSGGGNIIYGVEAVIPATLATGIGPGLEGHPASGGNLNWYRHLGREDGTFKWEGPKKVGTGWGDLNEVLTGGKDMIPNVPRARLCGTPDPSLSNIHINAFGAHGQPWGHLNLTYNVSVKNTTLSQSAVDGVIADAFRSWQKIAPIFSFTQVTGDANINIRFGGTELFSKFGSVDGVLAVGTFPETGTLFFDQTEPWNVNDKAKRNYFLGVAMHEIGHVLGLGHSTVSTSIMFPFASQKEIDDIIAKGIDKETVAGINGMYAWAPQQPLTDRGSATGPSLALAGNINFSNNDQTLFMAWRGADGDDSLYWSSLGGNRWSGQKKIAGAGSLHGPSLASGSSSNTTTGLMMVWDGVDGDDSIYYSQNLDPMARDWTARTKIDGTGTSSRPTVARFNEQYYMAWKGIAGDGGIYWSVFSGGNWSSQNKLVGSGTSEGPVLAAFNNRLYMIWKGIDGDSNVYYSWLDNQAGSNWQAQTQLRYPQVLAEGNIMMAIGSSNQLSATVHGDELLLAWKGVEGDSGIYFLRFKDEEWSGQTNIRGAGTAGTPAIASFNGKLHMVWRGIAGDTNLYYSTLG